MLTRRLKVYESANNRGDPCILLQGKWINKIGFKKGEHVDIQYDQGQINIVLIKEPDPQGTQANKRVRVKKTMS